MSRDASAFDAADAMVSLGLEMTLGGRPVRDLTQEILRRRLENPKGAAMRLPDAETLAAPRWALAVDDRAWTWFVNAASIVALVSLTWMLIPAGEPRRESPATPLDEETREEPPARNAPAPPEVRNAADISRLAAGLTGVRATGSEIRNAELRQLCARCPDLDTLVMWDTNVDDDGLAPLTSLASLRELSVSNCARLTDRALDFIAGLGNLEELDITGFVGQTASISGEPAEEYVAPYAKYTSEGIKHLARLPRLRRLELFGSNADHAAVKRILEAGSGELTSLGLGFTDVTDETLSILARQDRVRELDITSAAEVRGNRSLEIVAGISSLRSLAIGGNPFNHADYTSAGLHHLTKLPLRTLRVHSCSLLGRGNGWGMVGRIRTLEEVEVRDCKNFGDDDLAILARLPRLRSLGLAWTPEITDNLCEIVARSSLTELHLAGFDDLDSEALRKFWNATPRLHRLTLPDQTTLTR